MAGNHPPDSGHQLAGHHPRDLATMLIHVSANIQDESPSSVDDTIHRADVKHMDHALRHWNGDGSPVLRQTRGVAPGCSPPGHAHLSSTIL
jgi:hypothetical protein